MKLHFTDEFLSELDKVVEFFGLSKEQYLKGIDEEITNASKFQILDAYEEGYFSPTREKRVTSHRKCGIDFYLYSFSLESEDCYNWDEYWFFRKCQIEGKTTYLEFTKEFLTKIEKLAHKFSMTTEDFVWKIYSVFEDLEEKDFRKALEKGYLATEPYSYSFDMFDKDVEGFKFRIKCLELKRENCVNWDEYFKYRIKEYGVTIPE